MKGEKVPTEGPLVEIGAVDSAAIEAAAVTEEEAADSDLAAQGETSADLSQNLKLYALNAEQNAKSHSNQHLVRMFFAQNALSRREDSDPFFIFFYLLFLTFYA